MPPIRTVLLQALGTVAVLTFVGRVIRVLGGDDPPEDRAVRALQRACGHVADGARDHVGRRSGSDPLDRVTALLSWYSGVPQTIANGAVWCGVTWALTRDPRAALAPAAALALETGCFVTSAALVGRPRPEAVWRPEHPHATGSFPSGHTAAAFALHGTLADLIERRGVRGARVLGTVLRYVLPGAIGFSRVSRGQHHITDVLAGAALGRWSARAVRRAAIRRR